MKTAIIGLPMTGKTSLFTILTGVTQESRVGSMSVRTGVAKVPDARVDALAKLFDPPKITYATVEYLDCPVHLEGVAARSRASSPDSASPMPSRTSLRVFEDDTVPHEHGSVDPVRDLNDVDTELILSDLVVIEKRLERLEKDRKKARRPPNSTTSSSCCKRPRPCSKPTSRCAISSSTTKTRSASADSSSFRRSRCSAF